MQAAGEGAAHLLDDHHRLQEAGAAHDGVRRQVAPRQLQVNLHRRYVIRLRNLADACPLDRHWTGIGQVA